MDACPKSGFSNIVTCLISMFFVSHIFVIQNILLGNVIGNFSDSVRQLHICLFISDDKKLVYTACTLNYSPRTTYCNSIKITP